MSEGMMELLVMQCEATANKANPRDSYFAQLVLFFDD
jgi:hypothetical protein